MENKENLDEKPFVADPVEVERRMASLRKFLQPYFDAMALPKAKQDEHYESIRRNIPIELEKESRGVSDSQIFNARQARLQIPHHITQEEFDQVLLPSLLHISYIPNHKHTGSQAMYLCASTDWREQRSGKERLIGLCDADYVSTFIHLASDNYRVLIKCEQEGVKRVSAMYNRRVCVHCQKDRSAIIEVAPILAAIRAGVYPFAHVINDGGEMVYLCPGPKFMLLENGIDPVQFDAFLAAVKVSMAKHQADAAAKPKENP